MLHSHNKVCQIAVVCCIFIKLELKNGMQDRKLSCKLCSTHIFGCIFSYLICKIPLVNWAHQQAQIMHANKQRYHWAQFILSEFPCKLSSTISAL